MVILAYKEFWTCVFVWYFKQYNPDCKGTNDENYFIRLNKDKM